MVFRIKGRNLKKVIDAGVVAGPRLYLSGACLSQTSGHGDWGIAGQRKGESNLERLEVTRVVDGRDEMLEGARRNFALGAHYLKVIIRIYKLLLFNHVVLPIFDDNLHDNELELANDKKRKEESKK